MMTFREKSAAACLAILALAFGAYAWWAWSTPASLGGAVAMLAGAVVAQVVAMIAAHILFRFEGRPEAADERDRMVERLSQRNAYWVLFSALWGVIGLVILAAPGLLVFYALVAVVVAAELVRYGSQLVYYRRGL